jgi:hypothetical protein
VVLVTLYHAPGCHLCDDARRVLVEVQAEQPFTLHEVDISGDEELEHAHRIWLPVVEIEGGERFVFELVPDELRRALAAQSPSGAEGL